MRPGSETGVRALSIQAGALVALLGVFAIAGYNTSDNLRRIGYEPSFDFLWEPSGYKIDHPLIEYDERSSHARAAVVGLLKTLLLAAVGIVLASAVGIALGLMRLSGSRAISRLAAGLIEVGRGVPILLQIVIWHQLLVHYLPRPVDAWEVLPGLSISNRGLMVEDTVVLSNAFLAMCAALSFYTGAFIAEIVHRAVRAHRSGRLEAVSDVGIWPGPSVRKTILPPVIYQHMELIKNCSLGLAVGYMEIRGTISGISLNQTGEVLVCLPIAGALYLAMTLPLAALQRRYERRNLEALWERGIADGSAAARGAGRERIGQSRRRVSLWLRRAAELAVVTVFVAGLLSLLDWLVFDSVLDASNWQECREKGDGACWAAVIHGMEAIVYNHYPEDLHWRIDLAFGLLLVALVPPLLPRGRFRSAGLVLTAAYPVVMIWLAWGGVGLEPVDSHKFSSLQGLLILAVLGLALSLPVGLLLALARRSTLPVISGTAIAIVELVRSLPVPLLLLATVVMAAYASPPGFGLSPLLLAIIGLSAISAASVADALAPSLERPPDQPDGRDALVRSGRLRDAIPGLTNCVLELVRNTTLTGQFTIVFAVLYTQGEFGFTVMSTEWHMALALSFLALCSAIRAYARLLARRLEHGQAHPVVA